MFDLVWRVRSYLPGRYGQRCRIVVHGRRMNSVLVEFDDGTRVVTMKWFARPARGDDRMRLF